MDEQNFLRAIQANPENEVSRLVYADWLEERGDTTKAEFLRVEHQLSPLLAVHTEPKSLSRILGGRWIQPELPTRRFFRDPCYREMYGRLSELVPMMDLDWVQKVSIVSQGVLQGYEELRPMLSRWSTSKLSWADFEERLCDTFVGVYEREHVEASFLIPVDYRLSLSTFDATCAMHGWSASLGVPVWFNSEDSLLRLRESNFAGVDRTRAPGFWVPVGRYYGSRLHCVCCDQSHELYGTLVFFRKQPPFGEPTQIMSPNWLVYLRSIFAWATI